MNYRYIGLCFLFLLLSLPLTAQAGWGGGKGTGGGLFSEAKPASPGRVITVGGRLQPLRKISHNFTIDGYIDAVLVKVGDRVNKDQALIRITRDAIGETYRPVILESRLRGIVSEIHVYETEQVSPGKQAITILDNSGYRLLTSISDRDAQAVRNLGSLEITGSTPDGVPFTGKITGVSQEPDYSTGLFTITMEFRRQEGLYPGMVMFVDLPVQKAQGIMIEKSSVLSDESGNFIWILDEKNVLVRRSLSMGEESDGKIAVNDGLAPGEKYLTRPSGLEEEGLALRDLLKQTIGGSQGSGSE